MKKPLQNFVNAQPFLSTKYGKTRRQAYRVYQRKRLRQQRLAIVMVGLGVFLALLGFAVWGLCRSAKPLLDALLPEPQAIETTEFKAMMARDVGFTMTPSLLYDNPKDYAPLTAPVSGTSRDKLIPVLPAREDTNLKVELQQLLASYPPVFTPYLYFYNPMDGTYVEINGYKPVSAASVIKLPILLNYLIGLDKNLIQTDTPVLYADFHRAGGAGDLQYRDSGAIFTANHVAGQMIRISDNTCTNIMIHALGGTDAVNEKLASLGLRQTRIRNWLPDLEGTNTISPYEMVTILYNIDHGPLISDMARYDGIDILESTHNRRLLVSPLPENVRVAHKTGDIGTTLGDSGIVYMPDGGKYIISMQVERPFNDYTARDMVQRVSRHVYDHVSAKRHKALLQAQAASGI